MCNFQRIDDKKFLFVIDGWGTGGAQKVVFDLASYLVKLKHSVLIVSLFQSEELFEVPLNCGFEIVGIKKFYDFRNLLKFRRIVNEFNPNIVHSNLFASNVLCGILFYFQGQKVIKVEHNTYFNRNWLSWKIFRFTTTSKMRVVSVSSDVKKIVKQFSKMDSEVILNPVANEFNTNPRKRVISNFIFCGRLVKQKNPKLCVDSFQYALHHKHIPSDSKLIIVGDGPLFTEMKKYVDDLKLNKHLTFMGKIPHKTLMSLMHSSGVLISTSEIEGFALVRTEALRNGMCVVTTSTGGASETLLLENKDFPKGVFFTDDSIKCIALALGSALETKFWKDDAIIERIKLTDKFDVSTVVNAYFKI